MSRYKILESILQSHPRKWLVTGCAGFIGSHLVEALLGLGQHVVGLDNLSTGSLENLNAALAENTASPRGIFSFHRGDVADLATCREVCQGVDAVLHEAGYISVPGSIEEPLACHATNVTGTLNLLISARDAGVKNFVYASSAAVYGDDGSMPQREDRIGRPLSPYGASKLMDEQYAWLFSRGSGMCCVGLRYFNVFGPRQNPAGGYAAVLPLWIHTLVAGGQCVVNGDGTQTRDFCHVANVVQANLLAACADHEKVSGEVFNVALGGSTTLLELHEWICTKLEKQIPKFSSPPPRHGPARPGDIWHSSADISKIQAMLGFDPSVSVDAGLDETVAWYARGA